MASMGQKFIKYSEELKSEIINKYKNNQGTINSLSKEYNINIKTLQNWITKFNKGIDGAKDSRGKFSGRKKDADINYKERYEILKKYQAFLKAQRERK